MTDPLRVDVWWADLRQADVTLARTLPPAERARVRAVERPADRGRRLVGATLLQHAVAAARPDRAGAGPVEVDRTCEDCGAQHGRPVVDGGPHLSVAHAGLLVVVATCVAAPVGVDVERTERFGGSVEEAFGWVCREAAGKAGTDAGAGRGTEEQSGGSAVLDPPPPGSVAAPPRRSPEAGGGGEDPGNPRPR